MIQLKNGTWGVVGPICWQKTNCQQMGLQNQVDYEKKGGEVENQVGGLRF
jgi:hypothetical protein